MKVLLFVSFLLVLSFPACKKIKVKTLLPQKIIVESTLTTVNTATVDAQKQAVLGFNYSAQITAIHVSTGKMVKKGQLLAELESSDLRTIYSEAFSELKRSEKLYSEHLISEATFQGVKKNFEVAKSNLEKTKLIAPFDGMVTDLNIQLGELPVQNPNKPSIRLVDIEQRRIVGDLDELDLSKVKKGTKARVKIMAVRNEPIKATVDKIIPYVSNTRDQDRTSQVELLLLEKELNPSQIPVGASAEVEFIIDERTNNLAIPAKALLGNKSKYVFINENGLIKKVPVVVEIGNYDRVAIKSGLTENMHVILPADDIEFKEEMKIEEELTPWP